MEKLSDKAREKRNQYAREYRKKNKKKIAEYNRTYWERKLRKKLDSKKIGGNG